MPYEQLARILTSMDVALPEEPLSSGAPHYMLPESETCPICFVAMNYRSVGGLLAPIYRDVCARCEPLDALTFEEAQALSVGAVTMPRNHFQKAHG